MDGLRLQQRSILLLEGSLRNDDLALQCHCLCTRMRYRSRVRPYSFGSRLVVTPSRKAVCYSMTLPSRRTEMEPRHRGRPYDRQGGSEGGSCNYDNRGGGQGAQCSPPLRSRSRPMANTSRVHGKKDHVAIAGGKGILLRGKDTI